MYRATFSVKQNGMPVIRKYEYDIFAERYLEAFQPQALKTPVEVDINGFIENYLGLYLDYACLSHNGMYLGMMVFSDTDRLPYFDRETQTAEYMSARAGTVIIDARLSEAPMEKHRERFTMGHECAHSIFHSVYFSRRQREATTCFTLCRKAEKDKPAQRQFSDEDWMEVQANAFASAILMPRSAVRMLFGEHESLPRVDRVHRTVERMIEVFNVSEEAAIRRLRTLKLAIPEDMSTASERKEEKLLMVLAQLCRFSAEEERLMIERNIYYDEPISDPYLRTDVALARHEARWLEPDD